VDERLAANLLMAKPLSVKTVFRRDFAGQAEVLRW